jgi:hypothetical protein
VIPEIPDEIQSPMHFMRVKSMEFYGTDPAIIYAFRKTDLPVEPNTRVLFSKEELRAWDAAIAEFLGANPGHVIARTVDGLY